MEIKTYTQVEFTVSGADQNEMLVALLNGIGYDGFEEETGSLKAFIESEKFSREELDLLLKTIPVNYSLSVIEHQNWNAVWERDFEPVVLRDFAAVRAGFHEPVTGVKYELVITPKMSFGTGHHATTLLMMELMSGLRFQGKTVLDYGTGTGILAILAEKMGAVKVTAIDNDPWSIENAQENTAANGCSSIEVVLAEKIPEHTTFDIILANINLSVIRESLSAIVGACRPGTQVLLSGFLKSDEVILFRDLAMQGFICEHITQQEEWICLKVSIH